MRWPHVICCVRPTPDYRTALPPSGKYWRCVPNSAVRKTIRFKIVSKKAKFSLYNHIINYYCWGHDDEVMALCMDIHDKVCRESNGIYLLVCQYSDSDLTFCFQSHVHTFMLVEGLLQFLIMTSRGRRRPIIIPESFSSLITLFPVLLYVGTVMCNFTLFIYSCLLCINSCCPWGDGRFKRPGGVSDLSLSISGVTSASFSSSGLCHRTRLPPWRILHPRM